MRASERSSSSDTAHKLRRTTARDEPSVALLRRAARAGDRRRCCRDNRGRLRLLDDDRHSGQQGSSLCRDRQPGRNTQRERDRHRSRAQPQLVRSTALTGSPTFVGTNGTATITSLAIPKNAGDGAHTIYTLGDAAYNPSQASAAIVIDTAAPSASAQLSPTANAAGWNNTSPVSVALSANDGSGSGIDQTKYTTDGSDPTTSATSQVYTGTPFNISTQVTSP